MAGGDALSTIPTAIEWLREGHERLRGGVAVLNDEDLLRMRGHQSGTSQGVQWIIRTMIEHDFFHAGEITDIRALRQHNDQI